jgi:hypothetical protein
MDSVTATQAGNTLYSRVRELEAEIKKVKAERTLKQEDIERLGSYIRGMELEIKGHTEVISLLMKERLKDQKDIKKDS